MNKRKKWVSILAGVMAAIMLLSLILSLIPTRVHAASSSEIKKQIAALKDQKKELEGQMKDVQNQYEANEDEIADLVNQKNTIDQEIFLLYGQIENINQQIAAYALLIADKQDELDLAQSRLDELNEKNKERIRAMEEDGEITYWSVLFKASSFSDLLDRLSMIEEIAAADHKRLQEMNKAAEEVAAAQAALTTEKDELEVVKDEMDAAQLELDEKREKAEALLAELIAKGYELETLYAEMEAQEEAFLDEIAQKEKEYNEAKRQEWIQYMSTYVTEPPATKPTTSGGTSSSGGANSGTNSGTGSSSNSGSNTGSSSGGSSSSSAKWLVPCAYTYLSSPFGDRDAPTAGASSYHQGVDLAAPEGTPIYASRTGVVTAATFGKSAGYYVSINHGDGFSSIYMHMTHFVVKKGQAVSAGQVIGYVGSTGVSTGNHLHFGISYNGKYVNPANYVNLY